MFSETKNRTLAKIFGASPLINSFIVLSFYFSVAPVGTHLLLQIATFAFLSWVAAFIIIPVSLILLFWKSYRIVAFKILAICIIHLAVGILCFQLSLDIRRNAFIALAQRSCPVVTAIQQFETKYTKPPDKLEQLVPEFLPDVPQTGIGAYPNYELIIPNNLTAYEGNRWILRVKTPSGGINFDSFLYFPKQNYPLTGYGGVLEPLEDWVYVHE